MFRVNLSNITLSIKYKHNSLFFIGSTLVGYLITIIIHLLKTKC